MKVDTSQAEKWIRDDIFEFQGKLYRVLPTGKVVKYGQKRVIKPSDKTA